MKSFLSSAFTFLIFLTSSTIWSQGVPSAMNYQAIARQDDGTPITDTEISVRFSIRSSETDGIIQWQEEHLTNTNQFGLFTLNIGDGVSTGAGFSPSFDAIPWGSAAHYLQIDLLNSDGVYESMGVNQFLSVPYAFFAGSAADVDDNDNNPNNETIDDFTFENDVLTITEDGEDFSVDLGPRLSELDAGQGINLIQLVGDSLNIVEGSESFIVDLSGISSAWAESGDVVSNSAQNIGVGTDSPQSTLHIEGSLSAAVDQVVGPVVVDLDDTQQVILANVTIGSVTVNLPSASDCVGRQYTIKTMGSFGQPLTSSCTVIPVLGESIDNESDYVMSEFNSEFVTIISDGSNWWIIGEK